MKLPLTVPTSAVARNALVLIAVVAGGAALYWLRDILTPLAMAIFLMIMIDGVKRFIEEKTPLPRRWAGLAALLVVVLIFAASIAIWFPFVKMQDKICLKQEQDAAAE